MGAEDDQLVEGFTDRGSYRAGEKASLRLSVTRPGFLGDVTPGDGPLAVRVTVGRVGRTRDDVWVRDGLRVHPHDVPDDAAAAGVDWPIAVDIPIDESWPSGWYQVELASPDRHGSVRLAHAGFAVRAPAGGSGTPYLLVLATNTWNAYNDWGGPNLYTGGTRVSYARPLARGLLDRPDPALNRNANREPVPDPDVERWTRYVLDTRVCPWSGCAGWPSWEALFVAWAERNGYALDYAVNNDLADHPDVLDGHPAMLSVGHDEYWSAEMRDAVEAHVAAGSHVAFFSGNTSFWRVRVDDHGRTMACPKLHTSSDGCTSMWSDPNLGRPETRLTGVTFTRGGYARIGQGTPRGPGGYTVWQPDHWVFTGTGLRYGDLFGATDTIVGYECDGCAMTMSDGVPVPTHEDGCPPGFEILGTAPAHLWSKTEEHDEYPSGLSALRDIGELEETAAVLFGDSSPGSTDRITNGHAVLGTFRNGGTVVTTGCTDWTFGLDGGDPTVERITRNVLDRLGSPRWSE